MTKWEFDHINVETHTIVNNEGFTVSTFIGEDLTKMYKLRPIEV